MKDDKNVVLDCYACGLIDLPRIKNQGICCRECDNILIRSGTYEYKQMFDRIANYLAENAED